MDKGELRKKIRSLKKNLSDDERVEGARRVFSALRVMPAFLRAKDVLLYHSLPDELYTHEFLEAPPPGKRYYLPRVNDSNIEILPYQKASLHRGAYNIQEPTGDETVDILQIDLVVVPAMAYDKQCNRLGRGKGYYDRLLKDCHAITIGVCYGFQLVNTIEVEAHDVAVDYVIADGYGILRRRKR